MGVTWRIMKSSPGDQPTSSFRRQWVLAAERCFVPYPEHGGFHRLDSLIFTVHRKNLGIQYVAEAFFHLNSQTNGLSIQEILSVWCGTVLGFHPSMIARLNTFMGGLSTDVG